MTTETRLIDLSVGQLQDILSGFSPIADKWLTIEQSADLFQVSHSLIRKVRNRKKNPMPFVGTGKISRIQKSVAEAWWISNIGKY